jgi:hypothetical protein
MSHDSYIQQLHSDVFFEHLPLRAEEHIITFGLAQLRCRSGTDEATRASAEPPRKLLRDLTEGM